jgi:FkbM family methyltransferase
MLGTLGEFHPECGSLGKPASLISLEAIKRLPQQLMAVAAHPLNEGHRASALAGWFSWHIASRLRKRPTEVHLAGAAKLIVEPGMTGATGNIYFGLSEWVEMAFLLHLLRSDDTFVDVGANIGAYSILASGTVGCKSLAAEPVNATYLKLLRNIEANGLHPRMHADRIGLSHEKGVLRFTTGQDTTNHIVSAADAFAGAVEECPVETLDNWLCAEEPTLIKIDVEGHDQEVVNGCKTVLTKQSLKALIVETWFGDTSTVKGMASAANVLQSFGFQPYNYDPLRKVLSPLTEQDGGNVIFVRDVEFVRNRLITSKRTSLSMGRTI